MRAAGLAVVVGALVAVGAGDVLIRNAPASPAVVGHFPAAAATNVSAAAKVAVVFDRPLAGDADRLDFTLADASRGLRVGRRATRRGADRCRVRAHRAAPPRRLHRPGRGAAGRAAQGVDLHGAGEASPQRWPGRTGPAGDLGGQRLRRVPCRDPARRGIAGSAPGRQRRADSADPRGPPGGHRLRRRPRGGHDTGPADWVLAGGHLVVPVPPGRSPTSRATAGWVGRSSRATWSSTGGRRMVAGSRRSRSGSTGPPTSWRSPTMSTSSRRSRRARRRPRWRLWRRRRLLRRARLLRRPRRTQATPTRGAGVRPSPFAAWARHGGTGSQPSPSTSPGPVVLTRQGNPDGGRSGARRGRAPSGPTTSSSVPAPATPSPTTSTSSEVGRAAGG